MLIIVLSDEYFQQCYISSRTLLPLRFALFRNNVSGFSLKLTFGLKPQVGAIKIVCYCLQTISTFQVEWLLATLIFLKIIYKS